MRDVLPELLERGFPVEVGVHELRPRSRGDGDDAPARRHAVHDLPGLGEIGQQIAAGACGVEAFERARRVRAGQRDAGCVLVREVEEPLLHPRRRVVQRVLGGVRDALALEPLVEVEDVDVLRSPQVGRARDLPRHLFLPDVAHDGHELPGLDVGAEDGELREPVRQRLDAIHAARNPSQNAAMRLNAYLARSGVASRRRADELIRDGRVRVNGEPGELNTVVGRHDVVEVDGARVERQRLAYVLLNKPSGVVTTASDPQGRRTVVDLVPLEPRVVPVGRLDIDTTGALLLTNDGDLAHRLAHPRYGVPKIYEVDVAGSPSADVVARLRDGVELDDGPTAPARVRVLGRGPHWTRLELTLHEGRNRQVKRMCEAVGHPVRRLRRTRYSALDVDGLAIGEWRELTSGEVAALRAAVGL